MELIAIIIGHNGSSLTLNEFKVKDEYLFAGFEIKSSWYHAKIKFESSYERVKDSVMLLDKLISRDIEEVKFINEDGNVEINFALEKTGKIRISGCLIGNMLDASSLTYEMESDLQSLIDFYLNIKSALKIM